jgi:hypothetical protein
MPSRVAALPQFGESVVLHPRKPRRRSAADHAFTFTFNFHLGKTQNHSWCSGPVETPLGDITTCRAQTAPPIKALVTGYQAPTVS